MYVDMIRLPAPPLMGGAWLGGPSLGPDSLAGRPVFLDFWDYTSLSCLAGLPYIREWQRRYEGMGMTFIGVQVPGWSFGRERENFEGALERLKLPYRQLLDRDDKIRKAFGIQSVPCRYVMDKDGLLRFYQVGDEDYENTELFLQQVLREMDGSLEFPDLLAPLRREDRVGGFTLPVTSEARLGDRIGNRDDVEIGEEADLVFPPSIEDERAHLSGRWRRNAESRVLVGTGGVRLHCRAAEIFLLASHPEGAEIIVRLDGRPIEAEARGEDLTAGRHGETILEVGRPRPYQIVRGDEVAEHRLDLEGAGPDLAFYSFQFISRMPPEPS